MYTAPTDDMQFLIDDVLDVGTVLGELPHYADLGLGNDLTTALLDEAAKFALHSAFADPASPPDAPARESIEVRLVVVY